MPKFKVYTKRYITKFYEEVVEADNESDAASKVSLQVCYDTNLVKEETEATIMSKVELLP